jgi:hypothetical protein
MELVESIGADRELKRDIVIELRRKRAAMTSDQEVSVPVQSMADIGEEIEITSKPRWERNDPCFCGSEKAVHLCHGIALY